MTREELVWLTAVFDCEGCISVQKQKYFSRKSYIIRTREYPVISLGHCSLDLITRFHELVGFGRLYMNVKNKSGKYTYQSVKTGETKDYSYANKKISHRWCLTKQEEIEKFIQLIWNEWLSEHRRSKIIQLGLAPIGGDMAKHPHLLELVNNKTWRCTLDGCSFFVHIGLAHVLPGKSARCWKCNDIFVLTDEALKDHKPICDDCRLVSERDVVEVFNIDKYMAENARKRQQAIDEGHSPNCDAYVGGICTCVLSGKLDDVTSLDEVDQIEVYDPDDESE